jgi:hypothetical protein
MPNGLLDDLDPSPPPPSPVVGLLDDIDPARVPHAPPVVAPPAPTYVPPQSQVPPILDFLAGVKSAPEPTPPDQLHAMFSSTGLDEDLVQQLATLDPVQIRGILERTKGSKEGGRLDTLIRQLDPTGEKFGKLADRGPDAPQWIGPQDESKPLDDGMLSSIAGGAKTATASAVRNLLALVDTAGKFADNPLSDVAPDVAPFLPKEFQQQDHFLQPGLMQEADRGAQQAALDQPDTKTAKVAEMATGLVPWMVAPELAAAETAGGRMGGEGAALPQLGAGAAEGAASLLVPKVVSQAVGPLAQRFIKAPLAAALLDRVAPPVAKAITEGAGGTATGAVTGAALPAVSAGISAATGDPERAQAELEQSPESAAIMAVMEALTHGAGGAGHSPTYDAVDQARLQRAGRVHAMGDLWARPNDLFQQLENVPTDHPPDQTLRPQPAPLAPADAAALADTSRDTFEPMRKAAGVPADTPIEERGQKTEKEHAGAPLRESDLNTEHRQRQEDDERANALVGDRIDETQNNAVDQARAHADTLNVGEPAKGSEPEVPNGQVESRWVKGTPEDRSALAKAAGMELPDEVARYRWNDLTDGAQNALRKAHRLETGGPEPWLKPDEKPAPPVDATKTVPLAGGISQDGKTVYVDPRLPKTLTMDNGVVVDVHQATAEHEAGEKPGLDAGKPYLDAHEGPAADRENRYLKSIGVDPAEYNAKLKPHLDAIEASGKSDNLAPDLDKNQPHDQALGDVHRDIQRDVPVTPEGHSQDAEEWLKTLNPKDRATIEPIRKHRVETSDDRAGDKGNLQQELQIVKDQGRLEAKRKAREAAKSIAAGEKPVESRPVAEPVNEGDAQPVKEPAREPPAPAPARAAEPVKEPSPNTGTRPSMEPVKPPDAQGSINFKKPPAKAAKPQRPYDILDKIKELGGIKSKREDRGGKNSNLWEGKTKIPPHHEGLIGSPIKRHMSGEFKGQPMMDPNRPGQYARSGDMPDGMADQLKTAGYGDGYVDTMWRLIDEASKARGKWADDNREQPGPSTTEVERDAITGDHPGPVDSSFDFGANKKPPEKPPVPPGGGEEPAKPAEPDHAGTHLPGGRVRGEDNTQSVKATGNVARDAETAAKNELGPVGHEAQEPLKLEAKRRVEDDPQGETLRITEKLLYSTERLDAQDVFVATEVQELLRKSGDNVAYLRFIALRRERGSDAGRLLAAHHDPSPEGLHASGQAYVRGADPDGSRRVSGLHQEVRRLKALLARMPAGSGAGQERVAKRAALKEKRSKVNQEFHDLMGEFHKAMSGDPSTLKAETVPYQTALLAMTKVLKNRIYAAGLAAHDAVLAITDQLRGYRHDPNSHKVMQDAYDQARKDDPKLPELNVAEVVKNTYESRNLEAAKAKIKRYEGLIKYHEKEVADLAAMSAEERRRYFDGEAAKTVFPKEYQDVIDAHTATLDLLRKEQARLEEEVARQPSIDDQITEVKKSIAERTAKAQATHDKMKAMTDAERKEWLKSEEGKNNRPAEVLQAISDDRAHLEELHKENAKLRAEARHEEKPPGQVTLEQKIANEAERLALSERKLNERAAKLSGMSAAERAAEKAKNGPLPEIAELRKGSAERTEEVRKKIREMTERRAANKPDLPIDQQIKEAQEHIDELTAKAKANVEKLKGMTVEQRKAWLVSEAAKKQRPAEVQAAIAVEREHHKALIAEAAKLRSEARGPKPKKPPRPLEEQIALEQQRKDHVIESLTMRRDQLAAMSYEEREALYRSKQPDPALKAAQELTKEATGQLRNEVKRLANPKEFGPDAGPVLRQRAAIEKKIQRLLDRIDKEEAAGSKSADERLAYMKKHGFDMEGEGLPSWAKDPKAYARFLAAADASRGDKADLYREYYVMALHGVAAVGKKVLADPVSIGLDRVVKKTISAAIKSVATGSLDPFRELGYIWGATMPAMRKAFKAFGRTLWTEEYPHDITAADDLQHYPVNHFLSNKVTRHASMLPMVRAIDAGAKTFIVHSEVAGRAYRNAVDEAGNRLKGDDLQNFMSRELMDTNSPSWQQAIEHANRLTFTERPLEIVNKINRLKYEKPKDATGRALQIAATTLFPYTTIPSNLVKQGVMNWTPVVSDLMTIAKQFQRDPKTLEFKANVQSMSDDAAQAIIRWGAFMGLSALTGPDGVMTGDEDKQNPHSFKLFGKHFNYQHLGPASYALETAADYWNNPKAGADQAMLGLYKRMKEESIARPIMDLVKASEADDGWTKYGAKFLASFYPAVLRQVGSALNDDTENKLTSQKHGVAKGDWTDRVLTYALENMELKKPQPWKDAQGHTIKKESFGNGYSDFFWRLISPMRLGEVVPEKPARK